MALRQRTRLTAIHLAELVHQPLVHVTQAFELGCTEVAELGEQNLATCGLETRAKVIVANAAELGEHLAPGDGELLVYFYNSFEGRTFQATLDALALRRHHFLYVDPDQEDFLEQRGYQILRRAEGPYPPRRWLIATWTINRTNCP